jgi:nucleoside-diphosphate-sugar epimerase
MIIIFGGSGFLGSAISRHLQELKLDFRVVVRPQSNLLKLQGIPIEKILLIPPEFWNRTVFDLMPEAVICAFWEGVEANLRDSLEIQMANVEKINLLAKASIQSKVKSFMAFGSQAESESSDWPIVEQQLYNKDSAYSKAKSDLQIDLFEMFEACDTRFCWIRVFSVYGEGDSKNRLIPKIYKCATNDLIFKVHNAGLQWSYLHINDFVTAVSAIVSSSNLNGVVNIGNPKVSSIGEITDVTEKELLSLFPHWSGVSTHDKTFKLGKIPKTQKLFDIGWRPSISIEDGIRMTVEGLFRDSQRGREVESQ